MHRTPFTVLALVPAIALSLAACRSTNGKDVDTAGTGGDDSLTDSDGDGYFADDDCDDDDAAVHPGATEVCDGLDNNCDGETDEGVGTTYYADGDGDGYGDAGVTEEACARPADFVESGTDCDDANEDVHPAAAERCNGIDDNCDGNIDEDVQGVWYLDADEDGFGDPASSVDDCDPPDGYVADDTDCDDAYADTNPDAPEICDERDNNCDGAVDEGVTTAFYADTDGDGYGDVTTLVETCDPPSGFSDTAGDCDDAEAAVNPGASEVCNDIDDNCDGVIDEDTAVDASRWYADADVDGYGDPSTGVTACDAPSGSVADDTDCDDTNAAVNPAATEVCNGIDDDCDALVDGDDSSVDLATGGTWYADTDLDGYGDLSTGGWTCTQPTGTVADATDCDDTDIAVNPGASEVCNGIDDDCDTLVDGDDSSVDLATGGTWYADDDLDGYGDPSVGGWTCTQPSGTVTDDTDCDDTDAAVNPGASEVCNGIDDDCDALVDDDDSSVDLSTASTFYTDSDSDGYGDASSSAVACVAPSGTVTDATDCDDAVATTNPGATEACNGVDDNCDLTIDEGLLGSGGSCPAASCAVVHADQPSAGDDSYWLEGTAGTLFEAWCDMTKDGGGWTLVGSVVNEGSRTWDSLGVWTNSVGFGSYAAAQSADYKSEAFAEVEGDDLMVSTASYDFAFHGVIGALSFMDMVVAEYDTTTCATSYLASGADWSDGLTADEHDAHNFVVRPLDSNASCFPSTNETVIVGFQSASCCWVGGVGNTPGGQASWRTHDGSMMLGSSMSVDSCTAGVYPCNANGKVFSYGGFCYGTSCKETYIELYLR
jgi:hypothetical protein